ncbi:hypothetical protein [Bradyrhizobium lupini]
MALTRSTRQLVKVPLESRTVAIPRKPNVVSWTFVQFCAAFGFATYADYFNLLGYSTAGIGAAGKYTFFLILFAAFAQAWLRSERIAVGWNAPTIFFCFTLISLIPFAAQMISDGDTNSYASAFVPSLIFVISIAFDPRKVDPDLTKLNRGLLQWLCLLCVLYDGELIVRSYGGLSYFASVANQTNHLKSIVFVAALALAYLSHKSWALILFLLVLAAISELLRPSSTLLIALLVCGGLALLIKLHRVGLARWLSYGVLLTAAAAPFFLYFFPDAGSLITSFDEAAKSDALGATSNANVRLVIMNVAFQRVEASSWLVGEMFSGGTTVQISGLLPFWTGIYSSGLATIHSDYVCVLLEGGLLGYLAFNLAFFLFGNHALLVLTNSSGARRQLAGTGLVTLCALVIYCSTNPVLQAYQAAAIPFTILLCAQIALRLDKQSN